MHNRFIQAQVVLILVGHPLWFPGVMGGGPTFVGIRASLGYLSQVIPVHLGCRVELGCVGNELIFKVVFCL